MALNGASDAAGNSEAISTASEEESLTQISGGLDERRVGRSSRRPPGPQGDGVDDAEALDDEALEGLGTGIIEDTEALLETETGRTTLGTLIDRDIPEERDAEEALAIDGALKTLEDEDAFGIEVAMVADDTPMVVDTDDGARLVTGVPSGQASEVVMTPDGGQVLLLDDGLNADEVIIEVSDRVADVLIDVAAENGVLVDPEAVRKAVLARALVVAFEQLQVFSVPAFEARETVIRIGKAHDVVLDWEVWTRD